MSLLISASLLLNISFAFVFHRTLPRLGAVLQKTEKKEGLQVGSGYGHQEKASTSLGIGPLRGHVEGLCGSVQRRQEVALGIVKGPVKGTELP